MARRARIRSFCTYVFVRACKRNKNGEGQAFLTYKRNGYDEAVPLPPYPGLGIRDYRGFAATVKRQLSGEVAESESR